MKFFICYVILFFVVPYFLSNSFFLYKRANLFKFYIDKLNFISRIDKQLLEEYFGEFTDSTTMLILFRKTVLSKVTGNIIVLSIFLFLVYFVDLNAFRVGIITGILLSFFQYKDLFKQCPLSQTIKDLNNDLPILKINDERLKINLLRRTNETIRKYNKTPKWKLSLEI